MAFAQSHLSEAGEDDPSVLAELERTVALLAFEEPLNSPFGDLLAPSHRQKVSTYFYLFIHSVIKLEIFIIVFINLLN